MPLKVHPLADAFPPLPDDELRKLAESIARNGLRIPIKIFEGQILDGRNRHKAAELLGIELDRDRDYELFDGDFDDAVVLVTDLNLRRRDLSYPQKLKAVDTLASLARGRPRKKGSHEPFSGPGRPAAGPTLAEAAEKLGVSRAQVVRRRQVREEGAPELLDAVDAGQVPVYQAQKLLRLDKEEQRAAVEGGEPAVKEALAKAKAAPPKKPARELTEGEKRIRAGVRANNLFNEMAKLMMTVKSFVGALAEDNLEFTADQRELGRDFGRQLVTHGEWVQTLFSGEATGVTDEGLANLLNGEENR